MFEKQERRKYIDEQVGVYEPSYPLVTLSGAITLSSVKNIREFLRSNIWFNLVVEEGKNKMLERVRAFGGLEDQLLERILEHNPSLKVMHISIGGSYFQYGKEANDIDFNVLVEGSYFDYFISKDLKFLPNGVGDRLLKISFMVFGEDNIIGGFSVDDSLEAENYIHTDLVMREGLVMPWRNATLYGKKLVEVSMDKFNLLVRIGRQLFQARLYFEGKIGKQRTETEREFKALSRISEAVVYLGYFFPGLDIPTRRFLKRETRIKSGGGSVEEEVRKIYMEVLNLYKKALESLSDGSRPEIREELLELCGS